MHHLSAPVKRVTINSLSLLKSFGQVTYSGFEYSLGDSLPSFV